MAHPDRVPICRAVFDDALGANETSSSGPVMALTTIGAYQRYLATAE